MTSHDFRNDGSWSERADLLGQERKLHETSTFFREAQKGRRLDGSSNYEATRDLIQSGEAPYVQYPAASGPWADPVQPGLEPPFPGDISAVEPCGTAAEIERSIAELAASTGPLDMVPESTPSSALSASGANGRSGGCYPTRSPCSAARGPRAGPC